MTVFTKGFYDFNGFRHDALALGKKLPSLVRTLVSGSVSAALRERVMLAVTGVNDCRYCAFVHTNLARFSGLDEAEIRRLLSSDPGVESSGEDLFAVAFARHFARTKQNPDPEMTAKLVQQYGQQRAGELLLYLEAIFFANLAGNTVDAVLFRLKGRQR